MSQWHRAHPELVGSDSDPQVAYGSGYPAPWDMEPGFDAKVAAAEADSTHACSSDEGCGTTQCEPPDGVTCRECGEPLVSSREP